MSAARAYLPRALAVVDPAVPRPADGSVVNPAPYVRNGDIVRIRLRQTGTRVRIRVRFAELRRQGGRIDVHARVLTNKGVQHHVDLYATPEQWAGKMFLHGGDGVVYRCKARHSVDYTDSVVTISVPRACIGGPRWVQIAVSDLTAPADFDPNAPEEEQARQFTFRDDALSTGRSSGLTFSRRIHRG